MTTPFHRRPASVITPPDQRTPRQLHLDELYWQAYDAARYRQFGANHIPTGLDDEERRMYWAGLAGGDSARRSV